MHECNACFTFLVTVSLSPLIFCLLWRGVGRGEGHGVFWGGVGGGGGESVTYVKQLQSVHLRCSAAMVNVCFCFRVLRTSFLLVFFVLFWFGFWFVFVFVLFLLITLVRIDFMRCIWNLGDGILFHLNYGWRHIVSSSFSLDIHLLANEFEHIHRFLSTFILRCSLLTWNVILAYIIC